MITIWKYRVEIEKYQTLELLKGSEILSVQLVGLQPFIWVKVDTEQIEKEIRRFELIGTGEELKSSKNKFIGTLQFQGGKYVQHFFEIFD